MPKHSKDSLDYKLSPSKWVTGRTLLAWLTSHPEDLDREITFHMKNGPVSSGTYVGPMLHLTPKQRPYRIPYSPINNPELVFIIEEFDY